MAARDGSCRQGYSRLGLCTHTAPWSVANYSAHSTNYHSSSNTERSTTGLIGNSNMHTAGSVLHATHRRTNMTDIQKNTPGFIVFQHDNEHNKVRMHRANAGGSSRVQ